MSEIRLTPTADQIVTDNGQTVQERVVTVEGSGVPAGGTSGQVLSKASGADHDLTWTTVSGAGPISEIESADTTNSVLASNAEGVEIKINSSNVLQVNDSGQIIVGGGAADALTRETVRNTFTRQISNYSVANIGNNLERNYRPGVSISAPEVTPTNANLLRKEFYEYDSVLNDYRLMAYEQFKAGSIQYTGNPGIFWEMVTTDYNNVTAARIAIGASGNVAIGSSGSGVGGEKLNVNGGILLGNSSNTNLGALRFNGTEFQGYTAAGWTTFSASSDIILKTTTTQLVTGANFVNITELTSGTLIGPGNYQFWFSGAANSSSTTSGMGFRLVGVTASLSAVRSIIFVPQANSGTASSYQLLQVDGNVNAVSASTLSATVNFPIIGFGSFTVDGTGGGGTVALQMRPELSAQSVQIQAGAMLLIKKI